MSHRETHLVSRLPHLSEPTVQVYEFALDRATFTADEAEAALGLSREAVDEAVRGLVELRLARRTAADSEVLVAMNPEVAAAQVLLPAERALRVRQEEIEQVRSEMDALLPLFAESRGRLERSASVEALPNLDTVRAVLTRLAALCSTEVLTSQPGGARTTAVLEEAIVRDEGMLRRGVRMRTLYQHTARFSQPTIAYVERVGRLGAEVRTLSDGFPRLIVFDRERAVLSMRDEPMSAVLIRDPSVVDFTVAAFERTWSQAVPFARQANRGEIQALSEEAKRTIALLLVEGLDERAIARRLGMSLRTCQRHVSEIMDRLGARGRLQAGYLLRAHGLPAPSGREPAGWAGPAEAPDDPPPPDRS
ncbi:LuxR C-terminal-related transcriptional regulator [Kitasatospora sp. NPDC088134]|uniref:LuxR C-terminal-related transcriptional regulator n=1 Tax=Kitasatospora sp. NPDC088134 TaxID=3364071 RepID=UPI00380EAEA8